MALSAPNTPKTIYSTPGKRLLRPPQTPECFTKVTVETPVSARKRISRDKCDQESNLTVAVRIRPMNIRELNCVSTTNAVKVDNDQLIIRSNTLGIQPTNLDHIFEYDHIFWSCDEDDAKFASQEDVFDSIGVPLLESAFKGYNGCLFAYGQTGSGKSYSMMGNNGDVNEIKPTTGIIPRFCKELFAKIAGLDGHCTVSVEVSYFEIYNEKIHDLLTSNQRNALKVREHPNWGPYVVDLSVHTVKSYEELRYWLILGNKNRVTAATAMNEHSSRSHSIFTIEMSLLEGSKETDSCRRSKLSLVDLAGSERLPHAVNNNEERIKQGVSINKSLLTLGKVISALAEQKKGTYVPYRDSVLTWLLRESLGGNSLTSMLATITPASCNLEETLATLRYACQARSIVNRARINENPHDKLIRELRAEVERLRALRQDYERNNSLNSSTTHFDNTAEKEFELEQLRMKLGATEEHLLKAQTLWERRFVETQEIQMKELALAERQNAELESHLRVIRNSDNPVKLSPYRTNFLSDLEDMLLPDATDYKNKENCEPQRLHTPEELSLAMEQIYTVMENVLKPTVDSIEEETVKLLYARSFKLLGALETALNHSLTSQDSDNLKKTVTFKL